MSQWLAPIEEQTSFKKSSVVIYPKKKSVTGAIFHEAPYV